MRRFKTRYCTGIFFLLASSSLAWATDGIWVNTTGVGNWSDPANWSNGIIADGIGNIANFFDLNIATDSTVHLDTARTIGTLTFGQTNNWTLDNDGNTSNFLTLAGMGQPEIGVSQKSKVTISAVLAGTQGFKISGDGSLVLSANNTFTGGLTISNATVQLASPGALNLSGLNTVTVYFSTLSLAGNSVTIAGLTEASGGLIQNGSALPATLTIIGNGQSMNYVGSLQDGPGGGALSLVVGGNASQMLTGNNTFSGSVTINSGQLTLGGSNAFTGGVTINSGKLTIQNSGALNSTSPNAIAFGAGSSGTLNVGSNVTISRLTTDATSPGTTSITGNGATLTINNASDNTFAGAITGQIQLAKGGAGTLALSGNNSSKGGLTINSGTAVLSGSNTYSGTTTINQGTLLGTVANAFSSSSSANVATGATLNLGGFSQTIGGLSGAGTVTTTGANGVDILTVSSGTFSGVISDASGGRKVGLDKVALPNGNGSTLNLSGANTFSGPITVDQGTLFLTGGTLTTGEAIHVNGGTFMLSGGSLSVAAGQVIVSTGALMSQAGGSSNADVINNGTFIYSGGTFTGYLVNSGVASFGSNIIVGKGIENNGSISLSSMLTINGPGLVNEGTFTLSGGTLITTSIVGNGKFVFNAGTLSITQGNSSIANAIVTNSTNDTINISASNVSLGDATSLSGFSHEGTLTVGANSNLTLNSAGIAKLGILTSIAGGTINSPNGVTLVAGSSLTGSGAVNAEFSTSAGSVIQATGNLALGASGSPAGFHGDGKVIVGANMVTINDANAARLGTLVTIGSGSMPGTLNVSNGALIDFDQAITGTGTINSTNAAGQAIINNGLIAGNSPSQKITLSGYVKGVGALQNVQIGGTYSPGLSPAVVQTANLSLAPTNMLIVEIGGTAPGNGFDQIKDSGALTLGGALQVVLTGGFAPADGNTFDILDWATMSGRFSALQLPGLAAPLGWNTTRLYTSGTLAVTNLVPGDFNRDGRVDGSDVAAMLTALTDLNTFKARNGLSSADLLSIGDIDGSGAVTNADINALIGLLRSGGGSVTSVPEPISLLMLICALPWLGVFVVGQRGIRVSLPYIQPRTQH
jgi:autotransporter-associated beta strand protein